jgi:hypothetical protein
MSDETLRSHLLDFLEGRGAHVEVLRAISEFPVQFRGSRVPDVTHTPWQLLEHMRIAQWDILEFCRDASHVSPSFPDGYWPASAVPPDAGAWEKTVDSFRTDLRTMQDLVLDPTTDLFAGIPHGEGQTVLREALLLSDHNAYHLGQLMLVRRALEAE